MGITRGGSSSADALVTVARARGWAPLALSPIEMLPPTHAIADVLGLRTKPIRSFSGPAFTGVLVQGLAPVIVSCAAAVVDDDEQQHFDVVRWPVPWTLPMGRIEVEVGATDAYDDPALLDRFGAAGFRDVLTDAGVWMRAVQGGDPDAVARLAASPRLAAVARAGDALAATGFAAEAVDGHAAVFTWAPVGDGSTARWEALLAAGAGWATALAGW